MITLFITVAEKDLQAKARPELVSVPDILEGYDEIDLGYGRDIIRLS